MNKHNLKSGLLFTTSTAFAVAFIVIFFSGFFVAPVNAETTATTTPPSEIPPPPSSGGGGGGSSTNHSPTLSNLLQWDGSTVISEGYIVRYPFISFSANVSDTDGDQVRLQVELRRFEELFTGINDGGILTSDLVPSGWNNVRITRAGLSDGKYHWRARAIDSNGNKSGWQEFGVAGNIDFEIRTNQPPSPKTAIGQIDPNKPTIVITHGLQDDNYDEVSADGSFDELFSGFSSVRGREGAGYLIKQQLGNSVNVIQFVWPEAFQGASLLGYTQARWYADDAGIALAKYLTEKLGSTYNQPIHFIGHSLGTVVNAHAAKLFLDSTKEVRKAQVTILDYPNRTGVRSTPTNFFATLLQDLQSKLDLKIDNYYSLDSSAFGNVATGQIYNHQKLNNPNDVGDEIFSQEPKNTFSMNHAGVHQWYRWTMNPNGFNGTTYCEPDGTFNDPSIFFSGSLNPCEKGWYWSLFGQGGWNKFPTNQIGAPIVINEGAQLPLGDPHEFGCTYSVGIILCREQSSPYVIFNVAIPESAEFLSFDYRFPNIGDGDYVSVLIDNEPLWILAGSSAFNPSEFTNSGPIPLPQDLAAGTHKLTIALFGVGEKNAEFELKNIQTNKTEEHTARSLKELVVQNLTDVKTGEKKTDKKIEIVIKHILESLEADLWKDDGHLNFPKGVRVFAKEAEAIALMDTILRQDDKKENNDGDIIPDSVKRVFGLAISDLLSADRMLAEVSLQEARLKIVDDQKRREKMEKMIKKAEDAMLEAEEVANKKPAKAVIRYGKAWFFSQAAIKISEKLQIPEIPAVFFENE